MTDDPTPPSPAPRPRRPRRAGLRVGLALVVILVLTVASLYLARRELAREVLVGWLEARGVKAEVEIERLELDGVVARLRVGPLEDPEFAVERVDVTYGLRGFWSGRPFGVDVASVRLVRPVLRARWRDGKLSLGSLDRVLDELRQRPPEPDAAKPRIEVEGARARLDSPYGVVALKADARMADGKLMALRADLGPTALRGEDLFADISGGALALTTKGDRVDVALTLASDRLAVSDQEARGVKLQLTGQAPYPDLESRRGDGGLTLNAEVQAAALKSAGLAAQTAQASGRFEGRVNGWVDTLALTGPLRIAMTAATAKGADVAAQGMEAGFAGQVRWAKDDWRVQGTGSGKLRGAWSGLGAMAKADPGELAALKRAAQGFAVEAPGVAVSAGSKSTQVSLPSPIRISAANGVRAKISGRAGQALFADGEGAFEVDVAGGGLPAIDVAVARYRLGAEGVDATVQGRATGSFGPVRDGAVRTSGGVSMRDGQLAYAAKGCSPVSAARIEFGENDLRDLTTALCPTQGPLFSMADGAWRLRGMLKDSDAQAPFLEARLEGADITVDARGRSGDLAVAAQIADARLVDEASAQRFNPVTADGDLRLAADQVTGDFDLVGAGGYALAKARLEQDVASGEGGVTIDTGDLEFVQGGLQPVAISPLAAVVASPVTGKARFQGRIGWPGDSLTSSGELVVPSLDFKSPAGLVAGLSGDISFTSLVPLVTAPGQSLKVERIDSLAPLTHAALDFQLLEDVLQVTTGAVEIGGGRLELEPLRAPLDGSAFEGALNVENVQLSELVERSPFADRVSLDARVTGRLPFVLGPDGIRFINGKLEAVQPGRLSIRREALSDVAAVGGQAEVADGVPAAAVPETNTVTEFAFQALEYLAFDSLSAEVNSLPQGRLGVLFKVVGAHEPPQEQKLELGLGDLIDRDLLKRKLPLPSHTKVNLTLDTTLNLDQLLQDFVETQRAGSGPVQP